MPRILEIDQAPLARAQQKRSPTQPRTNGQVARMNRTIKDATLKRFHDETHGQLRSHLADVLAADILRPQAEDAERPPPFRMHLQNPDIRAGSEPSQTPIHQMPGLNP